MSEVTNVFIVGWSVNSGECIAQINGQMGARFNQEYRALDPGCVGGSKVLELDTWAAAFNHVPVDDILDIFAAAL